jgi:hypothetical protein
MVIPYLPIFTAEIGDTPINFLVGLIKMMDKTSKTRVIFNQDVDPVGEKHMLWHQNSFKESNRSFLSKHFAWHIL